MSGVSGGTHLELDGVRTAIKYEEPGNDDNAEAGGDCTDGYDVLRDAIDGQDGSRRKTKNGRVNPTRIFNY